MQDSDFFTNILLILIVAHFIVGFGYLIYKLSPRKKENSDDEDQNQSSQTD